MVLRLICPIVTSVQTKPMDFDTIDTDFWQEIADMPGEIFDIPDDDVLDFQQALNSGEDF